MKIKTEFDQLMLAYMTKGFREWDFIGMLPISQTEEYKFGIEGPYGMSYVAVYGNRNCSTPQSDDDQSREKKYISRGLTSIIVFYGSDNHSIMRRMTPKEYDAMILAPYRRMHGDLYYNS